jgi:predicted DNA-binding transcriptional regulator AlpA
MDRLLTTAQVGQALSRSADWVRRRCADGTFPHVRDGGQVFVRERDVQAWINERVQRRIQVEAAVTGNRVVDEIHRRRRERGNRRAS